MAADAPDFAQPTEPDGRRTRTRTGEPAPHVERQRLGREAAPRPTETHRYAPVGRERVSERTAAQKASIGMGAASAAIGALGFFAPVVTGNDDRIINRHNGKLLGIFAINPPHALAHLGLGIAGLVAGRSDEASRRYLEVSSAVYATLATAGFIKGRNRDGIYEFMGMALNTADNWLHTVWSAAAASIAARGERRAQRRVEPEFRRRAA